ncbi:isoprenylcysteine alpha-carbonyl methylesterase ICME isoform X3 [Elaeis guineensis]|uniref:protein-S-isoprenylcysteine alpha-carbonyl methylesterase n=1 Tax=Elaeis guineensis var. tenera TaxID=51953 RepID=A0A8N4EYN9_ELAGV|nr:probable isoprenylcysteine alpha-carbonyl methylesterase ICMEL2 isoform X6 [Elaeis guineensis]
MAEAAGDRRPAAVEDANIEKPLLRWSPSSNMRRRASGDLSLGLSCPSRRPSFRRDVGHAAAETYRITRLALTLLQYLGVGYRWMTKFLALACYAILLMPGFLQVGYYYFFSTQVRRSIVYGEQPRNRLDLYLPKDSNEPKPVVAFVTGGAWIIGYKAWGALLGRRLAERDIIVACIDYRNFPQGTISDMITDASEGISFICNNIASYGGDPHRVYLMGQSAGAHIAACTLLEQAIKEAAGESITWSVSQIKAYVGLSGGKDFVDALQTVGAKAKLVLYEGKTHTDLFIQDPLRGGRDQLLEDLVAVIHASDASALAKDAVAPRAGQLVFEWQLKMARQISPF